MASNKLVWSTNAEITLDETMAYYTNLNKKFAKNLLKDINNYTLKLTKFPKLGKLVFEKKCYQLIIGKYSVFYKIFDKHILIVLFWDNQRNPALLEQELSKVL